MKSKIYWGISLGLVILVGLLTIGCGSTNKDLQQENAFLQEAEVKGSEDSALQLTLAMASPGGVWQAIAEGVAQSVRQQYPGSRIEVITGSMGGNAVSVQEKKVDIALSHAPNAKLAIEGKSPYDNQNPDLRGLSSIFVGPIHVVAPANSPINSFNDVKESQYPLKMSINSKGSTVEFLSEAILNQYNISIDDISDWGGDITYLSTADGFSLLLEGVNNMGILSSYLPSTAVLELSTNLDIKLLSLDENVIDYLNKNYGTMTSIIPDGTYSFQNGDVITAGSPVILIVHKDIPDEVAYKIVESIDNQRDYLNNVHDAFKTLTLEKMLKDMGDLPVHPGALKYYQDNGIAN